MMEFVTLVSRTRRAIDGRALAPLTATECRSSLVSSERAGLISELDGRRVTVLRHGSGSEGPITADGVWVAVDGLAVVPGRGTDITGSLVRYTAPETSLSDVTRLAGDLRGTFVVCASLGDGSIVVVNDPLSSYPVFVATTAAHYAITNNPLILEAALALVGDPIARSASGLGMEAVFGSGALGSSGFDEVRLVPAGHYVLAAANGEVHTREAAPAVRRYRSGDPFDVLLDRAADEIRENVRSVAAGPYQVRVADLTGGVDSRIVLAGLLAEGVEDQFGYFCSGKHPGPDYSTSAYLQDVYRLTEARGWLPHAALTFEDDPVAAMRHLLFRTMGCYSHNFLSGVGTPREPGLLRLHGGFGETFRSFYAESFDGVTPADATAHLLRMRRWDWRRPMLAAGFADDVERRLEASLRSRCDAGVSAADALEHWYLEHRNRYHIGLIWRLRLLQHASFHPLYSPAAVQASYEIPHRERARNRVGFELMRRLHEPLTLLPFAEYRWPQELIAGTADERLLRDTPPFSPTSPIVRCFAPGRVRKERPVPRPVLGRQFRRGAQPRSAWAEEQLRLGRPHWYQPFDRVLPAAREYVRSLDEGSNVWDVFDRDRSVGLLDRQLDDGWEAREIQIVYKLLAAGIWVSRDEVSNAAGEALSDDFSMA